MIVEGKKFVEYLRLCGQGLFLARRDLVGGLISEVRNQGKESHASQNFQRPIG
jgi:hypothetical protein